MARERYAQIGDYRLDTAARSLWLEAELVRLTPKAVELLTILARAAPEAVTKDELMRQLWPDSFVCEANLPNLVAEIRTRLDDRVQPPRYVRTAYRVGYALCCEVRWRMSLTEEGFHQVESDCYVVLNRQERSLLYGENLIGRGPDCRVCVRSPTVSRHHASIEVGAERAEIRDIGSRNGTFLDGKRLKGARQIRDGARVRVGSVSMTFHVCDPRKETAPSE